MSKPLTKHGWNWAAVPADVIISGELSANDVRLYSYLLWRAGKHDSAWPNLTTISKDITLSEGGIKRSLKSLLKNNWIKRHRRFGRSSLTVVYETQSDCLLDHGRSDDQITGDLTIGSPVIPLNKSQVKEKHRTSTERTPVAPPAVEAYRRASNRYPTKSVWADMSQAIGEDPNKIELWEMTVKQWILKGWRPDNIGGMFDIFKQGGFKSDNHNGKRPADKTPINNRKTGGWISTPANYGTPEKTK